MGRAKALPSQFGLTGARQTPYFAICVQIAISLAVTLIMGLAWNETKAFGFLGFTNGLAGAVAFILVLLAAMVYFTRVEPEKGILRNLLIPCVGIAILVPAVYTAFYPNPGEPLKWSPYVILGWTLLGGVYMLVRDREQAQSVIDVDYADADLREIVSPLA
jgi:amino acid transporter